MSETVRLELTPDRTICAIHGELFAHNWPVGYPTFAVMAFQKLIDSKRFMDKLEGKFPKNIDAVHKELDKSPVCCQLHPSALIEVLMRVNGEDKVWEKKKCRGCNRMRCGTVYRMTGSIGRPKKTFSHLCLSCVVHRIQPLGLN